MLKLLRPGRVAVFAQSGLSLGYSGMVPGKLEHGTSVALCEGESMKKTRGKPVVCLLMRQLAAVGLVLAWWSSYTATGGEGGRDTGTRNSMQ